MFRECWHWIDIRFKVSAVILYALEFIFNINDDVIHDTMANNNF